MSQVNSPYKRILVKLSGEALMGEGDYGIDPDAVRRLSHELQPVADDGVQIAIVVGGGNICRGAGLAGSGIDRVTGDHMGMLATVINALAIQDVMEAEGFDTRVMSALRINEVCEDYVRRRANRHLEKGRLLIFAAGTGNPFFTTDSAASLRAIEIGADLMLKATKVDGIYDDDPVTNPQAERYEHLTYDDALGQGLKVMDQTALVLCRDHRLPIRVYNMSSTGDLWRIVKGDRKVGTHVDSGH